MGQLQRLSDINFRQGEALSNKKARYERIASTKSRRPFTELSGIGRGRGLLICGSGPSLRKSVDEIKRLQRWSNCMVLAVNTAHDYLVDQGVRIDFGAMLDPRPWVKSYMTPQRGTKYLLASQIDPGVWPRFDGFETYVWHCLTEGDDEDALSARMRFTKRRWMKGGNTILLRSFMWSRPEWADFEYVRLFGCDSSFEHEVHVAPKGADVIVDRTRNKLRLADPTTGRPLGRSYTTNGSMMAQAEWFQKETTGILAAQHRKDFDPSFGIMVHGDGLLPDIAALMYIHSGGIPRRNEVINAPWEDSVEAKIIYLPEHNCHPVSSDIKTLTLNVGEIDWSEVNGHQHA